MKLILVCFLVCFNLTITKAQEAKEIVTIKVDKECKTHINKRTYKNEIATIGMVLVNKHVSLSEVANSSMGFIYKENAVLNGSIPMLQFGCNSTFFTMYDLTNIYIKIDDKEYHFDKTIEFQKVEVEQGDEVIYWYAFGFHLNEDLHISFDNFSTFSFSVPNQKTGELKTWEQKGKNVNQLRDMFDCFVSHYKPLEAELNKGKEANVKKNPLSNTSTLKECTSAQCSELTQKNARCKNKTTNCNGRCHLHQ